MADVLLARTDGIEGFERHVVLKQIRSEHAKDQRFIQMFLDEARVAASLHHANIVQVHDIGQASGEFFFAMEYIHGEDLRKMLGVVSKNKTHMPLGYVCAIVSAAAAGLHYAHERRGADKKPLNIVHRDVSPSNIIVTYDGSVKLVDFGIAKAALRQVETRSGSLKGKVSYMSPEQCKGDAIDRRSDVYALGVLLYELATTTRLFKGDNDYLLMDAIVNGKVPLPRVRRPDLPNELSSIIMRALATEPDRRFQSADELRVALDQFAAGANLTVSQSQLQGYMKKLFGERPEPWLELEREPVVPNSTWTSLPAVVEDPDKTRTGSNRARSKPQTTSPPPTRSRTSQNMGWEQHTPLPDPPARGRGKWIALAALPLVAAAGFGVWKFAIEPRMESPSAPAVAATAPAAGAATMVRAAEPTVVPIETPAPAAAPVVAAAMPSEAAVAPPPGAAAAAPESPLAVAPMREPSRSRSRHAAAAKIAAAPSAAPAAPVAAVSAPARAPAPPVSAPAPAVSAPARAPASAPAPGTAPASVPAAAAVATPAPTRVAAPAVAPTAPAPVELQIAQLSQATVEMIASDHSSQLGKCDSAAGDVHGEVSVVFQIDGTGKVVKSQLSTSVKNPKLAGCILKAVVSWKFPRPPTGAAKGTYSIDYQ